VEKYGEDIFRKTRGGISAKNRRTSCAAFGDFLAIREKSERK